jgi:hypothetical protein
MVRCPKRKAHASQGFGRIHNSTYQDERFAIVNANSFPQMKAPAQGFPQPAHSSLLRFFASLLLCFCFSYR